MKTDEIRKQFPLIWQGALENSKAQSKLVYLDSAATSQKPKAVLKAISNYYEQQNANIHRGLYPISVETTQKWQQAHETVAQFINARSYEEIVFTRSATESINLVATSYGETFNEGDVIILTEMEHHSNIVPWQALAKRKRLKIEWLSVLEDFTLDIQYMNFLVRKYGEKIKMLSIVEVSNVLGVRNDLKPFIELAHSVGAKVLVDAAQSITLNKVDVRKLKADFLVFSGHKMFAPTGIGVLYAKKSLLEKMEPYQYGGEMISSVNKLGAKWNDLPYKFEAGTPNIEGGLVLAKAIEWINTNLNWEQYRAHNQGLLSILIAGLSSIPEISFFGPKAVSSRESLVAFTVRGIHPHDIGSLLAEKGVAVRAGFHCAEPLHQRFGLASTVRVSLAPYNTADEIRYFIEALKDCIKQFK